MAENYTYPPKNNFEQQEDNLFNDILYKYLPYWPLFLVLMLICGSSAWLYLRYKVPVYEATATVLIKDEKKGMNDSKLLQSLDLFAGKKIVENEIEVMHSRTLAKEVVKDLHLYAPVYSVGKFSDRSAYISSPVTIEVASPDSLKPVKRVDFRFSNNQVWIGNKAYALNQWYDTS
jgi:uncharacterized protein involved in exopolysaccharide biosynthesis